MLNDVSRETRLLLAAFGLLPGVMVGILVRTVRTDGQQMALGSFVVLVVVALVVLVVASVVHGVRLARGQRRLFDEIDRGSAEIVAGRVEAAPVPGRVVRRRIAGRRAAYLATSAVALPPPAVTLVVTALTDPPRRLAAQVPATLGLHARRAPVWVVPHPSLPEVGVLDDRVSAGDVAAGEADPRWSTTSLPTDRTVVGGYLTLLAAALAGLVVAAVVTVLVGALQ